MFWIFFTMFHSNHKPTVTLVSKWKSTWHFNVKNTVLLLILDPILEVGRSLIIRRDLRKIIGPGLICEVIRVYLTRNCCRCWKAQKVGEHWIEIWSVNDCWNVEQLKYTCESKEPCFVDHNVVFACTKFINFVHIACKL